MFFILQIDADVPKKFEEGNFVTLTHTHRHVCMCGGGGKGHHACIKYFPSFEIRDFNVNGSLCFKVNMRCYNTYICI